MHIQRIIGLLVVTLCCIPHTWAQVTAEQRWHTGSVFYYVTKTEMMWQFQGGTCHEGGYNFGLLPDGDEYIMTEFNPYDDTPIDYTSHKGQIGDKVVARKIGDTELLIDYHEGKVVETFIRFQGSLQEVIQQNMLKAIEGVYQDLTTGKRIIIHPDCTLEGIPGISRFTFGEEYETPSNVLVLDNKKCLRYKLSMEGVNLYETTLNEGDVYSDDGKQVYRLKKISSLLGQAHDTPGRWPFASYEVLTNGLLTEFPTEMLQLIRNEIFARHSYNFTEGGKMQLYFGGQSWYNPGNPNNAIELNEIEKINVSLIQSMEKDEFRWGPELDQ